MLDKAIEPIRIISKGDAASVAAAICIFHSLTNKKASLRVVQHYTNDELEALMREQYPTFILIDCPEQPYKTLKNALFLSAEESYKLSGENKLAYVMLAGLYGRFMEYGIEINADNILQDALKSGKINMTNFQQMADIDEKFYISLELKDEPFFKKLPEFADMLVACIRTGKANIALSAVLGDEGSKEIASGIWLSYKNEVKEALNWYKQNNAKFTTSGALIVNMKDYVPHYVISSVASKLAKSNNIVLVMSYISGDLIKVSLRCRGKNTNVVQIIARMFKDIEGEYGGDELNAGGTLSRSDEDRFISMAQTILNQVAVEETINS